MRRPSFRKKPAFTLAELLISLGILGVIAMFTIPKIMNVQQDQRNKSIMKAHISTMAGLVQAARLSGDFLSYQAGEALLTQQSIIKRLNYVRQCTAVGPGSPASPCFPGITPF